MTRLVLALLFFWLTIPAALAHERSASSSSWTVEGERVTGTVDLQARQATLFLSIYPEGTTLEGGYRRRLIDGLFLKRGGEACDQAAIPEIRLLRDGRLRAQLEWLCPQSSGEVELAVDVFAPLSANHIHFTRMRFGEGDWQEDVISRGRSLVRFSKTDRDGNGWSRAGQFVRTGIAHILSGPDHLAFLCALLLVVSRWRRLLLVTAGFTVGHSITLALASLGWISPVGAAIEALIGFSILFLAAEAALGGRVPSRLIAVSPVLALSALAAVNLASGGAIAAGVWFGLVVMVFAYGQWLRAGGDPQTSAPALSAGFGLVHGVGFAGVMLELQLAAGHRLPALVGFNIGVELGQVAFILGVLAVSTTIFKRLDRRVLDRARTAAIFTLAGLGGYWFVERAWS